MSYFSVDLFRNVNRTFRLVFAPRTQNMGTKEWNLKKSSARGRIQKIVNSSWLVLTACGRRNAIKRKAGRFTLLSHQYNQIWKKTGAKRRCMFHFLDVWSLLCWHLENVRPDSRLQIAVSLCCRSSSIGFVSLFFVGIHIQALSLKIFVEHPLERKSCNFFWGNKMSTNSKLGQKLGHYRHAVLPSWQFRPFVTCTIWGSFWLMCVTPKKQLCCTGM